MGVYITSQTRHRELESYYPLLDEYYHKTLKVLQLKDEYDLSMILVGPITIRKINRDYRGIDRQTDVISFASLDEGDDFTPQGENVNLGDIFINYRRVFEQAEEYEHSVKREFVFLFVHGLLHLLGYDHMKEEDEKVMFGLQKKILGKLA